jgi:hypothetical protein|tara:strand:+ start:320 stop:565 length:246 start_codon:yes stop_codon:yes gene_type:complete
MTRFHLRNGIRVQYTAEEETIRDAEEEQAAINKAEYDALKYQRDRKAEYPSIVDQLDYIYHNGIDAWKATIKVTKDKYPKT